MDFVITEDARIIEDQVVRFLNEKIIPAEGVYAEQAKSVENGVDPEVMIDLRAEAKSLGLSDDRVFVLRGNPAGEIRNLAKELDAGAIIVGTHGRHGMGLMFLGSTASGVLHGTHCDVLAVRISEAA